MASFAPVNFYNRIRLAMRHRWDRLDATFLDSRYLATKGGQEGTSTYQVWEYMIEVPATAGGAPVRLTFKEQSHRVRPPKSGDDVPVVVNPKRTKAMFDYSDPRIDADSWRDEQRAQLQKGDKERFEARLAGRDPAPDLENEF